MFFQGHSEMEDNTIEEKTMNDTKIEVRNFMFSNISLHKIKFVLAANKNIHTG